MYIGKELSHYRDMNPEKIALYTDKEAISYDEFVAGVERYRAHLRLFGASETEAKVALFIGNEPAFLQVFFAVISLGLIGVPMDPNWTKVETEQVIDEVNPDFIVASRQFNQSLIDAFPITFFIEDVPEDMREGLDYSPNDVSGDTLFYLGFTSGSTGVPKGFYRDHRSWLTSFMAGESVFNHGQEDVFLAPGPLCYSLSLYVAVYALDRGASLYLFPRFSEQAILDAISREGKCFVYVVPTMLQALSSARVKMDEPVTFISSGAKLQETVRKNTLASFPKCTIYEYYGASELSLVTYMDELSLIDYPESVGRPFPGVELSIRNEKGDLLGPGEIGELYVSSPFTFRQYIRKEQTDEVITAYGLSIGDLAYINEDHYLFIVGRKKNMLISGGRNVYPEEIEKVLLTHPSVKELAVVGIPHPYWGEKIVAFLSWKAGYEASLKSIRNYSRKHLANYKRPQQWVVVDSFPYTATGKIDRQELVKMFKEDMDE